MRTIQALWTRSFTWVVKGCGLALVLAAVASPAQAGFNSPEIDPGSMGSALALLSGGVLLLSDRFRRR
jgi:hypothetical protein